MATLSVNNSAGRAQSPYLRGCKSHGFVVGIAIVFLYVALRPCFGSGVKPAALSGLIYGVIGYVLPNLLSAPLGLFPARLVMLTTLVGLAEAVTASIVGARFYKE